MDKLEGTSRKQKQLCLECGSEYEAAIHTLFGHDLDLAKGRCLECRKRIVAEEEAREEALRSLEIAKKLSLWREESGIPPKFMNEEFGTFDTKRAGNVKYVYQKCLSYAKGFPIDYQAYVRKEVKAYRSLVLVSIDVWGIGKSHLACSIGHNILNRWKGEDITNPILFISEPDLYRSIQRTYNYTPEEKRYLETEDDIIKSLIYRPLLILDDVGKERRTKPDFVQRILFAIIDGRYKNLRPIVMTTNLSSDSLRDYMGAGSDEASFDRLWEMTGGEFVVLKGESYRRKE